MLVDTSVWIDHFRRSDPALVAALDRGDVECHDFILGELACGTLPRRDAILTLMQTLPRVEAVPNHQAIAFVTQRRLWGRGLGWVDASLLAAAILAGTPLWTLDRRLRKTAQDLGINWEPN
jgi:hypothetical protein